MTDLQMEASDRLYYGIASLTGWDDALRHATHFGGANNTRIGRVLSAILLAGGEHRAPVAVTGEIDDDGTGLIVVLYSDLLVMAATEGFRGTAGEVTVTLHSLDDVNRVQVSTDHNYYDGLTRYARDSGIVVTIEIAGREVTFSSRGYDATVLTEESAVSAALTVFARHKAGSRLNAAN